MLENRLGLIIVHLKADNESQLQTKLFELGLETAKVPDVLAIYPKGSSIVAWVRVEKKYIELSGKEVKKAAKKKTKKKTKAN